MTSKPKYELQAGAPSDESVRIILGALCEAILANEDGVRRDLDPEFLHDFRVAVRRTRSALAQLKGALPRKPAAEFRAEFSWLGKVSGPTRDLDVHLLALRAHQAELPAAVRRALEPLASFLQRQRDQEHDRLIQQLDSHRYERLMRDWRQFLHSPVAWEEKAHEAKRPIREMAAERIDKRYRRVLERGQAIDAESADSAFHRLRIDCKKLRYLLEFFRSLYDPATIGPLIKTLKGLQDNLGSFNDAVVQRATLEQVGAQIAAASPTPAETLAAIQDLVERHEARQAEERLRFDDAFEELASAEHRAQFRRLFDLHPTVTSSETGAPG